MEQRERRRCGASRREVKRGKRTVGRLDKLERLLMVREVRKGEIREVREQ